MKRGGPLKRSSLKRRRRPRVLEPERAVWNEPTAGFCECGCGRFSFRLHRHHVLLRQTVQREGGSVWSLRNSMLLSPDHHAGHHSGFRKVALERVPEDAIAFAVDLLGEARAADYFARRYDCEQTRVAA